MTIPVQTPTGDPTEPTAPPRADGSAIEGRSLGQIAWRRLRRDKVALGGGVLIILLLLIAIFAPLLISWFGQPPDEWHTDLVDPNTQIPMGTFGGMSKEHLLGVEPQTGRDIFSRVLQGSRISLLIAFLATVLSVTIGCTLGIIAGYFGGRVDALISRLMDLFLAFPLLVFAIALAGVVPDQAFGLSGNGLRVALLVFIVGFFNWPYIGRIVRGQTLALREREFIDASRSLGARSPYVIVNEVLPNLIAPILIYATLLIPTNILFEAALSYLGVGVRPPTATWGGMLSDAVTYYNTPSFMLWPGLAIFITVLAFNLFGDGLRDALDPKGH